MPPSGFFLTCCACSEPSWPTPATPRRERWLLIGLIAWLASPIDLIPEFLPGIGPLDDIVVAALVLRHVANRLGRNHLRAHWPGDDDGFSLIERLL